MSSRQFRQVAPRGFSRRFYEALEGGGSGAIELDPNELEEIDDLGDEQDLLTATDIPALRPAHHAGAPDENTSPVPKSSLPGEG